MYLGGNSKKISRPENWKFDRAVMGLESGEGGIQGGKSPKKKRGQLKIHRQGQKYQRGLNERRINYGENGDGNT